jgi:hypothetical protein
VWRLVQDHVDPDLLFTATEFGIFFTVDGGAEWIELEGGIPTIAFRDITIQRTQQDVVAGSFGRGIFILDDYTPLRNLSEDMLAREAVLFPIRTAPWYLPRNVVDSEGHDDYQAENPPFGAVFTYYLRDGFQSLEAQRQEGERALAEGEDVPFPGWEALEHEEREQGPTAQVVVRDAAGTVVNRVSGPTAAGVHRVNWDLRYASADVVEVGDSGTGNGFLVLPGSYTATLVAIEQGQVSELAGPVSFDVEPLRDGALPRVSDDIVTQFRAELETFQQDLARADHLLDDLIERIGAMQTALERADAADTALTRRLYATRLELLELRKQVEGSEPKDEIGEIGSPSPANRFYVGVRGLNTTYGPTEMHRRAVAAGRSELAELESGLDRVAEQVMPELERALEAAGAPPIERAGR